MIIPTAGIPEKPETINLSCNICNLPGCTAVGTASAMVPLSTPKAAACPLKASSTPLEKGGDNSRGGQMKNNRKTNQGVKK
jgi:hypothetical protein